MPIDKDNPVSFLLGFKTLLDIYLCLTTGLLRLFYPGFVSLAFSFWD